MSLQRVVPLTPALMQDDEIGEGELAEFEEPEEQAWFSAFTARV